MELLVEFCGDNPDCSSATKEEHQCAKATKKIHRRATKVGHKRNGDKVEIPLHHTLDAKLRHAILTLLMRHNLLANTLKTSVFSKDRDIAVHLAIDLYALYDLLAIALQATVEVVQFNT